MVCSYQGTCLEKTNVSELVCSYQGTCLEKTNVFECSCTVVLLDLVEYDRGRDGHKEPRISTPDKNEKYKSIILNFDGNDILSPDFSLSIIHERL